MTKLTGDTLKAYQLISRYVDDFSDLIEYRDFNGGSLSVRKAKFFIQQDLPCLEEFDVDWPALVETINNV